jgi:hypothetical protein
MGNSMTAARQQRKLLFWLWMAEFGLAATLPAVLVVSAILSAGPSRAAPAERIVVDRNSGLAISGFDPVAYFTDAKPLLGKGEFEQKVAGAVWRFRNAGNRAAFVADPDVYMPRYGGYDPVNVARGVTVAGNPLLWLISGEQLYLFYAVETRNEFVRERERVIPTADGAWPVLRRRFEP